MGVFGSAFNPPTLGHLDVIQQAAPEFDVILLVPSASHAFSKHLESFEHRVAMLNAFLNDVSIERCQLELCTVEVQLHEQSPDKPVYTFDLLEWLEEHHDQGARLGFIRGPDNAAPETWRRFYKAEEIEERWSLFTAKERLKVRSSLVRQRVASITSEMADKTIFDGMLSPSVRDYMLSNKLYQS